MKTDNETELKPCLDEIIADIVSTLHCDDISEIKSEIESSIYNLRTYEIDTRPKPTLKSSEGLVEAGVALERLESFKELVDKHKRLSDDKGLTPLMHTNTINRALDNIIKAITPTPETASEGEKWISVEDITDIENTYWMWHEVYGEPYQGFLGHRDMWYESDSTDDSRPISPQPTMITEFNKPTPPTQDNEGEG